MKVDLFIFGTGMYVIGRGVSGFGTILPAIIEFNRNNKSITLNVHVFTTSLESETKFHKNLKSLSDCLNPKHIPFELKTYIASDKKEVTKIINNTKGDVRIAIISIPDHLHYDYIKLCGELSCHTLTTKPFVETTKQAKELNDFFYNANLYGAVEFHKRYDDSNIIAKDIINRGKIGILSSVMVEYSQKISIPAEIFKKWTEKTNIFQYLGVHYVDQVSFVTGAKPIKVMAVGTNSKLLSLGINTYDEIIANVKWKLGDNHFYAVYRTGWIDNDSSHATSLQKISYYGTEGHLLLDQTNRGIELLACNSIEKINPYFSQGHHNTKQGINFRGYGIQSIISFMKDVLDLKNKEISLDELKNSRSDFSSSICSVAVSEAVNLSLKSSSMWVDVKL